MWGSKVNGWIDEQQTAVYVDYSGPAPAWYDPKADRIVVNPQKSLPRPQLLEERAAQMWRAKEEWRDTTARLAREVLPLDR